MIILLIGETRSVQGVEGVIPDLKVDLLFDLEKSRYAHIFCRNVPEDLTEHLL
jgi:hypothetical protein